MGNEGEEGTPPALVPILASDRSNGSTSSSQAEPDITTGGPSSLPEDAKVLANVIGQLTALEDEAKTASVKRGIASQRDKLIALLSAELKLSLKRRFRKAVTGDESKRVRDHIREPPVARYIDKWAFTFGVFILTITEFILVKYPAKFWVYYMIVIPFLVSCRIPHYRSLKWEFFMLDFCYYTQVLCIMLLYVFPTSCRFFKAVFILSNGPLACSVPAWRNSLVFHDIEKITSLYIHVFPALLLYSTRWYGNATSGDARPGPLCGDDGLCWSDMVHAVLLYVLWQVMYFVKVEMVEKAKLDADPELLTSLRWLAQDKKNSLHQLVLFLTRRWGVLRRDETFDHRTLKTKLIFIATQFVYTIATSLPSLLTYRYHFLHIAYGLAIFVAAIYNGATYYIEVFSVRYVNKYPHERPAGLGAGRVRSHAADGSGGGMVPAAVEIQRSRSEGNNSSSATTTTTTIISAPAVVAALEQEAVMVVKKTN